MFNRYCVLEPFVHLACVVPIVSDIHGPLSGLAIELSVP